MTPGMTLLGPALGLSAILSRVRPSQRSIANYVWLIRCVGDPVFCAPNIGSAGHLGAQHTPLFVGSATNHPAMPTFRAPDELQNEMVSDVPTQPASDVPGKIRFGMSDSRIQVEFREIVEPDTGAQQRGDSPAQKVVFQVHIGTDHERAVTEGELHAA